MQQLILIPVCLIAGYALKRARVLPANAAETINALIIHVAFPALVLAQVPQLSGAVKDARALLAPAFAPWLGFAVSAAAVLTGARIFGWSRSTSGALLLTAGLGNTSFLGFPLIEALYGPGAMPYALVLDQAGSFLVLSTAGLVSAGYLSGGAVHPGRILVRIFFFPPVIALAAGLILDAAGALSPLLSLCQRLGSLLVPLALLSVGCQLHVEAAVVRRRLPELSYGLGVKLVIVPLAVALAAWLSGPMDVALRVSVLEMAMGPMITGAIVAANFDLDAELANLMVGLGTPLSLATVGIWYVLI